MAFIVDDNGNITLVQGDSGLLVVEGLPTEKNYTVYFSIYNSKRVRMGSEIYVSTNYAPSVSLVISAEFTDTLTVPKNEETETYYYGIKLCDSVTGEEDTLCIEDGSIGDLNTVTVYPKKVEGLTND